MIVVCPHCLSANRVPAERTTEDPTCGRCEHALLPGHPVALTDATFAKVVGRTELPVVVDFWAAWCGPCRQMAPQFDAAAARLKGRALLAKVDSDSSPQTSAQYAIRSIPTLLLFRGGREARRQSGAVAAASIVAFAESAESADGAG